MGIHARRDVCEILQVFVSESKDVIFHDNFIFQPIGLTSHNQFFPEPQSIRGSGLSIIIIVQGDNSTCSKPLVDFITKVPLWPGLGRPG